MLRVLAAKFSTCFLFLLALVLVELASGCVTRSFGPAIVKGSTQIEQIFALTPSPLVWPKASLLKVLAPDTLSLSVPGVVGSQVISLAGVKSLRSEHFETWRSRSLARYIPGEKMNVIVFARGDRGRILAKILDERGNVSIWLAEQGLVLPFLMCRGIDDCSAETLSRIGVAEIADACERGGQSVQESSAPRAADFSVEELLSMRIQWVGDIRTKEYVPVRYASDVPPCQRIYFQAQDYQQEQETELNMPHSQVFGPSKSNFRLKPEYRLSRRTQR